MMKRVTDRMLVAVCAAAAALCLAGADPQGRAMFGNALSVLSGSGATHQAFEQQYQVLNAYDAGLGFYLAILFPWLATGEAYDRIYSQNATRATGAGITPRSSTPVDRLTITQFTVGTTSLFIRAEWPEDVILPYYWIYLKGKRDLNEEEWQTLGFMDVTPGPGPGWAEQEFLLDELMWDDWDSPDAPRVAFFKLEAPECPEGWYWEPVEEEDGDPPDFPPLVDWDGGTWDFWEANLLSLDHQAVSSAESAPVLPGMQYLITLKAYYLPIYQAEQDDVFSWEITVPGGQVIAGSAHTAELALCPFSGLPLFRDFWVVTIPWPESSRAGGQSIDANLSITPNFPPPDLHGFSSFGMSVKNISLFQYNMPMSAVDANTGKVTGSTDFGDYGAKYIPTNEIAYITGQPAPPALAMYMYVPNYTDNMNFAWRMTVETERPGYRSVPPPLGRNPDYRQYPTNGLYTAYANTLWFNVTQDLMGNEIIGGKCKIYYKIRDNLTGKVTEGQYPFFIKGMNPPDALARAYIDDVVASNFISYAWAIIRHESRSKSGYVYNQFNAAGPTIWLPNKTDDDKETGEKRWGWGMAQIDKGALDNPTNTHFVTTAEVYNWRTNVLSAAKKMSDSLATHDRFMGYFKSAYGDSVKPPQYVPYLVGGRTMTTEEFAVTTMYNGVRKVPWSKIRGRSDFRSPVAYNLSGNREWTFHHNDKKYAELVALEMQKNQPIKE